MGQVHGEEGYTLRFHPARSRSLRSVSPCTRCLAFARCHDNRYLLKKEKQLMIKTMRESAKKKEREKGGDEEKEGDFL